MAEESSGRDRIVAGGILTVIAVVAAGITLPFGESVIGVQLAAIGRAFSASGSALQWLVNGYMLTFATSILVMGIAADRLGRRRLFGWGLVLLGGANIAAILAPNLATLITARALAGFGAGTLLATGPALLAARFPDDNRPRARAFAAFGAAAGGGIAFGPLVGGLIMDLAGWRAVFAVYLPFVALAGLLMPWIAPSRERDAPPADIPGVALFVAMLALGVLAIQGGQYAPGSRAALVVLAVVCLVALVWVERHRRHPAIEPGLFANPVFRVMSLTMICWQIGVAISMVYVPAVVVAGLDASPSHAGASILPMAILLFAATPLGPWLVRRGGIRGFVVICIGVMVVGEVIIWASLTAPSPWPTVGLLTGLALIGLGGGAANGSMDNLAMGTIPAARAGMAAGLFQTVRIGAAALAVAAAGSVVTIGDSTHATTAAHASASITARYSLLAGVAALVMACIALFCFFLLRRASTPEHTT